MKHMFHGKNIDIVQRLGRMQPELSPKMAKLGSYISANYLKAAFMSTRELAAAAGVSPVTVVRFITLLGYSDFDSLRTAVQERVNFELSGVERLKTLPAGKRTSATLLRRIIDADFESLNALAHSFSEPQVEIFCEALRRSPRVTILGVRYVSPLAIYFAYALSKIRDGVQAFTQADSTLYDRVHMMDGGDVLVAIAFARYPADLLALARYAHQHKVRIMAITDSPLSPVQPLAEVALYAKCNLLDFVGSLAAPAALINLLVSHTGVRMGDAALKRLESYEDAASEAGIYLGARTGKKIKVKG